MADITFLGLNRSVCEAICLLMQAFFPAHFGEVTDAVNPDAKSPEMTARAREILTPALAVVLRSREEAEKQSNVFFDALPSVREVLDTDIEAAYYGDPAATGRVAVILTYPGFYATFIPAQRSGVISSSTTEQGSSSAKRRPSGSMSKSISM